MSLGSNNKMKKKKEYTPNRFERTYKGNMPTETATTEGLFNVCMEMWKIDKH